MMMKECGEGDSRDRSRKRETLLQRYDIPIQQLDYKYVRTCSDPKRLERILRVLRSGEEGFYPDLEQFVCRRLSEVDSSSRLLRSAVPIVRKESLGTQEQTELESDLSKWIQNTNLEVTDPDEMTSTASLPIRQSSTITKIDTPKEKPGTGQVPFLKQANPNRIKSWEYDKWSKFDVDTELMKLDMEEMQAKETERIERTKLAKTKAEINSDKSLTEKGPKSDENVGSCSKSDKVTAISTHSSASVSKSAKSEGKVMQEVKVTSGPIKTLPSEVDKSQGRSFIEELPNEPVQIAEKKVEPKRRFKIIIDDVNAGHF